jgi:hypothetical protein
MITEPLSRRLFLGGILCAPAIVRSGVLMPIKPLVVPASDPFKIMLWTDVSGIAHWNCVDFTLAENLGAYRDSTAARHIFTNCRFSGNPAPLFGWR